MNYISSEKARMRSSELGFWGSEVILEILWVREHLAGRPHPQINQSEQHSISSILNQTP